MITNDNYFNVENRLKYMSVSQFKDFKGTLHTHGCEANAIANCMDEKPFSTKPTTAMLVGSYVDAYFEGSLSQFKAQNPDIFTLKGELKSEFQKANHIIQVAEADPLYMKFMSGKKQQIMTAEIFGYIWKIKIDSLIEDVAIVDQKVMASLSSRNWSEKEKRYVNFVDYFGYDIQGAIYQEVVYRNTGKRLPFYLAVLTKEAVVDKEIIQIDQSSLDNAMDYVKQNIETIAFLKSGKGNPVRCESCSYCISTKVLTNPIWNYDLKF